MFRNAEIFNQYLSDWGNLVFKILKHLKNNLIFKNSFRLEETAQTRESRGAQARRPAPACYVGVAIRHGWWTRRCRRVSATWRAAPRALPRPFPVPAPGAGRSPGPASLGLARLHRPRPPSRAWGSASLLLSNRDDFSPFGELRVDSRAAGGSVSTSPAGSSRGVRVGGTGRGRGALTAGRLDVPRAQRARPAPLSRPPGWSAARAPRAVRGRFEAFLWMEAIAQSGVRAFCGLVSWTTGQWLPVAAALEVSHLLGSFSFSREPFPAVKTCASARPRRQHEACRSPGRGGAGWKTAAVLSRPDGARDGRTHRGRTAADPHTPLTANCPGETSGQRGRGRSECCGAQARGRQRRAALLPGPGPGPASGRTGPSRTQVSVTSPGLEAEQDPDPVGLSRKSMKRELERSPLLFNYLE